MDSRLFTTAVLAMCSILLLPGCPGSRSGTVAENFNYRLKWAVLPPENPLVVIEGILVPMPNELGVCGNKLLSFDAIRAMLRSGEPAMFQCSIPVFASYDAPDAGQRDLLHDDSHVTRNGSTTDANANYEITNRTAHDIENVPLDTPTQVRIDARGAAVNNSGNFQAVECLSPSFFEFRQTDNDFAFSPVRNETFCEVTFTRMDSGARRASGSFIGVFKNKDDINDRRILIVLDGHFAMSFTSS